MKMETLQRKLDWYSRLDPALFERMRLGTTIAEIEAWRHRIGGQFGVRPGKRFFDWKKHTFLWEQTGDWAFSPNIVFNEGLAYVIDTAFREVSDIAPWYIAYFTDDVTPAAGDSYASPSWTEATGTNIDETVRQAWVDGSPTGTTTRSVAGAAVTYTGDNSHTAFGAIMVGGGSAPTTLGNTAGGGTAHAGSKFASSIGMTLDATIDITYTLTATDDGA